MPANPSPSATEWARRWKDLQKFIRRERNTMKRLLETGSYSEHDRGFYGGIKHGCFSVRREMTRLARKPSGRKGRER